MSEKTVARSAMQILSNRGYTPQKFESYEEVVAAHGQMNHQAAVEMTRAALEHSRNFRRLWLEKRMKRAAIPPAFQSRTLDNFQVSDERQGKVVGLMRRYVENFEAMRQGPTNLALLGASRRGKGHLACAVANALMAQEYLCLYARSAEIWRTLRDSYKSKNITETDVITSFTDPDLLVVDELGRETGDWKKAAAFVSEIFNKRHESMKPTILISNLGPDELARLLGQHIYHRLTENQGAVIECNWERYRK